MKKGKYLAILCIMAMGLTACKGNQSGENTEIGEKTVFYTKDESLYVASADEKAPVCLGDGVFYDDYRAKTSADGQLVYWLIPEDDGTDKFSGELKVSQMSEEASVVDDNVRGFEIYENNRVVYQTADEKIYLSGKDGEKEMLAEQGMLYESDKQGSTIVWGGGSDSEMQMFMKNMASEEPVKKIDGIQSLLYSSADYMTLVVQKQDGIYLIEKFSETKKLPDGITNVLGSCSGYIIYNRQDGDEIKSYLYADGQEYMLEYNLNTGIFVADEADKKGYVLILQDENTWAVPSMYSIDFKEKGAMAHKADEVLEIYSARNGICYYSKSTGASSGKVDLYCNGELVESSIDAYMAWQPEGSKQLWFAKDSDTDTGSFTLKYCEDGKASEAAKNVYSAKLCTDGRAFVLTDYDKTAEKGTLSLYNQSELIEIDKDVREIYMPDIIG